MLYKKVIIDGYILGVGKVKSNGNINEDEYIELTNLLGDIPISEPGYRYRLRADTLEWELCEVQNDEEQLPYTENQLLVMTAHELKVICAEMGISESMTKANMISLIMQKQLENII